MSYAYTSPQNGKVKRILRTINNMLCSLLFQTSISTRYWVEGFHITTYLLNRLPTKAINMTSPYFTLYGVTPVTPHVMASLITFIKVLIENRIHQLAQF
jgi:hypothetical protein